MPGATMAATIHVDLFGGVEISGADPAQLRGGSRAVALLACLASRPRVPQPRAHLSGLLWPESTGPQARTNLRRELHHLRALLGETSCLELDGGALSWHPGAEVVVDVSDFLTACQETLAAVDSDNREDVENSGGRALSLYRGPFLPGFYDDWVLTAREDLRRSCVDLCDQVAAYLLAHEDASAATTFARRRVLLEPLEETGYRLLMQAQRGAGDRAGAMRTYHQCASLLERELGVAPSPETRAEVDVALADTDREPGGNRSGVAATHALPSGLVGRESECARLMSAWEGARERVTLVVVTGEAGVGKTRLVAEFARAVRSQGALVATTRCFAATGTVPLAPVADWLRHPQVRAAAKCLERVWLTEVERLVPEGESTTEPGSGARAKVDAWQRLRFFEGLARALLAVDRPLLLTLDDLQWCDKATISWLSFLLTCTGSAPLLIVATARADELDGSELTRMLGTMQDVGDAEVVRLENLSTQDTSQLAERVLDHGVDEEELGMLMSATAGNPLYLVEALRAASSSPGRVEPTDLQGVLTSRLTKLTGPARELATLASAVGRDFTLDLLLEASDLDADTVVRLVDDLWRRRILEERGRGYDFTHDLLRDEAYRMASPPRRWLLHRRLAQALELLHPEGTESVAAQLAHQHDHSGRPERALPYYEIAARRATAVFAHAESVRLWQRCLQLLEELPASRQRDRRELGVLQELLPPMNAWRGYASATLEQYERRTALLGERLGLTEVRCAAAIALFATTFVQGHTAEAHEWGKQGL
ncbi:MAG: AAA family ATPase, partial [Nocardioides sp.]|nr:AAA family ATPase [Nocardioides sp.]